MRRLASAVVMILAAGLASGRPDTTDPAAMQEEADRIFELELQISRALAERDREAFANLAGTTQGFFDVKQGYVLPVGAWALFFEPKDGVSYDRVPTDVTVSASLDLAFTRGSFEISGPPREGRPCLRQGEYVAVWRRPSDDSAWHLVANGPIEEWDPGRYAYSVVDSQIGEQVRIDHNKELSFAEGGTLRTAAAEDLAYSMHEYWTALFDEGGHAYAVYGQALVLWEKPQETWIVSTVSTPVPHLEQHYPEGSDLEILWDRVCRSQLPVPAKETAR